jgi:hypothetical protein
MRTGAFRPRDMGSSTMVRYAIFFGIEQWNCSGIYCLLLSYYSLGICVMLIGTVLPSMDYGPYWHSYFVYISLLIGFLRDLIML